MWLLVVVAAVAVAAVFMRARPAEEPRIATLPMPRWDEPPIPVNGGQREISRFGAGVAVTVFVDYTEPKPLPDADYRRWEVASGNHGREVLILGCTPWELSACSDWSELVDGMRRLELPDGEFSMRTKNVRDYAVDDLRIHGVYGFGNATVLGRKCAVAMARYNLWERDLILVIASSEPDAQFFSRAERTILSLRDTVITASRHGSGSKREDKLPAGARSRQRSSPSGSGTR